MQLYGMLLIDKQRIKMVKDDILEPYLEPLY